MKFKFAVLTIFILSAFINPQVSFAKPRSRAQLIDAYYREFVSASIRLDYPQIDTALRAVLTKLPEDAFRVVINRRRPILFLTNITSGIARYANATEFTVEEKDPPTFTKGFYIIILGDELNTIADPEAIEGILFHEIAHRYLDHLKSTKHPCEREKEANRLVKSWGFEKEFLKAKKAFGSKEKGDSPCQDYKA